MKDDIHFFGWMILANVTQNRLLGIGFAVMAVIYSIKLMANQFKPKE